MSEFPSSQIPSTPNQGDPKIAAPWLLKFHAGDRSTLEECYMDFFETVQGALSKYLQGADQETVIHETFYQLISDESMRKNFQGGSFAAWLCTVARNRALDYLRRQKREQNATPLIAAELDVERGEGVSLDDQLEASRTVEKFKKTCLPAKWLPVFENRFLLQLSQREAAQKIGIHRTTLVYQETRIRSLLRRFMLQEA